MQKHWAILLVQRKHLYSQQLTCTLEIHQELKFPDSRFEAWQCPQESEQGARNSLESDVPVIVYPCSIFAASATQRPPAVTPPSPARSPYRISNEALDLKISRVNLTRLTGHNPHQTRERVIESARSETRDTLCRKFAT